MTPVGAFVSSPSGYGTYDQSGDVWQWEETSISGLRRAQSGGSWAGDDFTISSSSYNYPLPTLVNPTVGFRLENISSSVPEPSTGAILAVAAVAGLYSRRHLNNPNAEPLVSYGNNDPTAKLVVQQNTAGASFVASTRNTLANYFTKSVKYEKIGRV